MFWYGIAVTAILALCAVANVADNRLSAGTRVASLIIYIAVIGYVVQSAILLR